MREYHLICQNHMPEQIAAAARESVGPAQPTGRGLGYVPALNGVRGLAVLFVLGNHLPLRSFESLLPGGFAGVDIFFVLSGFLITTLLIEEFEGTGAIRLRNFYTRRALRLLPALIVLLLTICIFSFFALDAAAARQQYFNSLIALFYISNWVRVLTHNQLGVLAHTWSLSVEEQFYLLWPLILLTLLRFSKKRRYFFIVAALIALLSWAACIHLALKGASNIRMCFGSDSRVDTLMAGCILAGIWSWKLTAQNLNKRFQKILTVIAPLSFVSLVAFAIIPNLFGKGLFYYGFILLALLAAALLLDVLINPRSIMKKVFEMKWLVWLGSVSYGLYLWHWTILWAMHGMKWNHWTIVLTGVPLSFAMTLLSYYGMERRILRYKNRFAPKND